MCLIKIRAPTRTCLLSRCAYQPLPSNGSNPLFAFNFYMFNSLYVVNIDIPIDVSSVNIVHDNQLIK